MLSFSLFLFFFNDTATTEIYTLSLHDALPIFKTGDEYGKDAVVAFEDLIGRKIGVRRVYHLWNDVFPDSEDEWVRDRGTTLIMSWQTTTDGVPDVYWRDISAGKYDRVIHARAAHIKAFGAPLFFIF